MVVFAEQCEAVAIRGGAAGDRSVMANGNHDANGDSGADGGNHRKDADGLGRAWSYLCLGVAGSKDEEADAEDDRGEFLLRRRDHREPRASEFRPEALL